MPAPRRLADKESVATARPSASGGARGRDDDVAGPSQAFTRQMITSARNRVSAISANTPNQP
jgi:hypothetical protein